jgi:hypothetical protein
MCIEKGTVIAKRASCTFELTDKTVGYKRYRYFSLSNIHISSWSNLGSKKMQGASFAGT